VLAQSRAVLVSLSVTGPTNIMADSDIDSLNNVFKSTFL